MCSKTAPRCKAIVERFLVTALDLVGLSFQRVSDQPFAKAVCDVDRLPPGAQTERSMSCEVIERRAWWGMDDTKLEKLARLSGKAASKALGALERRGYDIRGKLSAPVSRVPRRNPQKPKSDE
jgi:hypothetical protein